MEVKNSYKLIEDKSGHVQDSIIESFIGGRPKLPPTTNVPVCKLCGSQLTFFFQITFPIEHEWGGFTMSVFACTSCFDERYLIPEMINGPLQGVNISDGFLKEYQKNFTILVFKTAESSIVTNYVEKVRYSTIELIEFNQLTTRVDKIGGIPNWYLEDESPATYNNNIPMMFIMQILEDRKFEILEGVPGQVQMDYFSGKLEPSKKRYYELFLANNLYFFGTRDRLNPLVYVLTQI
ncbi:hypothetical protein [Paenibacillus qinlingensis]|uniref:Uncharacterized protein n=1 Tax=Paenibacillus qinlingensis TaxID=1837343 RepID=A0ABU1P1Y8_9BACL|nr:hypothetical protein [Paenibacillus qinlingensis]MDR6553766.1 hypothetical protein [Paenibacillus qinlingensis]